MPKLLTQQRCGPIGLEMSSRALHMIQFSQDRRKVIDAVRWELPLSGNDSPEEPTMNDWVEALGDARRGRAFRGRDVVVCLGASELFVQNIRVAKGHSGDMDKTIQQEAASRLPFPVGEAEIRYVCAGEVRQGEQIKREVILLASHRRVIERLLETVDRAGLRALAVEIEPSAMLRAYAKQFRRDADKAQRLVYLRFGAANASVVIAQGSEVFFVKYLDVGGDAMDEAVARHLKISRAEAATLRRHNGERRTDQQDPDVARSLVEATRGVIEKLISELSLCIRYHSVTFRGQPLARVVIGGSEATPGLVEMLGTRVDLPCELGDPLRNCDATLPATRHASWDVAAGLALRSIS